MFQRMMRGLQGAKPQLAGDRVLHGAGRVPAGRPNLGFLLRASISVFAFVALPAFCAGINGTGIAFCASDTSISGVSCSAVSVDGQSDPRQNGRYGRDAQASVGQLTKIGDGVEGFDYTKISNSGSDLPATATLGSGPDEWACTRDNVTGLIWEVKTPFGLRSQSNTYSWYSSDSTSNGGAQGYPSAGSCSNTDRCDTEKFVQDVNNAGLCGTGVWRMPTVKELEGLSDFGIINPAIDNTTYFPNTPVLHFWSGTASANGQPTTSSYYAWIVDALDGSARAEFRSTALGVRLVRGGS